MCTLFLFQVHKSLPLDVLQQMDAGLIKVLITDITNGSTVVSFHLLIAEDVDIYYIITAFRDAIEHSSYFTVDKNSVSINGKELLIAQLFFRTRKIIKPIIFFEVKISVKQMDEKPFSLLYCFCLSIR